MAAESEQVQVERATAFLISLHTLLYFDFSSSPAYRRQYIF